MLLNEFLKEHAKVQDLEHRMAALSARLDEQGAEIHKMTAQRQASSPAIDLVRN
jgi:division protein CdvB (Snf7/Vps24/ESCRT-III family)